MDGLFFWGNVFTQGLWGLRLYNTLRTGSRANEIVHVNFHIRLANVPLSVKWHISIALVAAT